MKIRLWVKRKQCRNQAIVGITAETAQRKKASATVRDIGLALFLLSFIAVGFRRPFLLVLAYCYVDIVAPQRLSYYLVNSIPVSLIVFCLAVGMWAVADEKRAIRYSSRQALLMVLLVYCGMTTLMADFPVEAAEKWSWVWKALLWAGFLPLTLTTRLRIEALATTLILCAASIFVTGGIKTILGGGGYGTLALLVSNNSGLYEGSTAAMAAIALIPLVLWFRKYSTIFGGNPTERKLLDLFCYALCFACLLVPVGTQARTGLLCIAMLVMLGLRDSKRRIVYMIGIGVAAVVAVSFVPDSYSQRMETIQGHKSDQSASSRLAIWAWTWNYAKDHPFGGGFDAYRGNRIVIDLVEDEGGQEKTNQLVDAGRAYHSAYFEMLGEQGYPGLAIWLLFNAMGVIQMNKIRRKYRNAEGNAAWISPLATALQSTQLIYLVGAGFIAVAFQPFIFMVFALQIGLSSYLHRREQEGTFRTTAAAPKVEESRGFR